MSAQPPASPSANAPPPVPKDVNVGTLDRPLTASSVGGPAGTSQAAELGGPSRLVIPEAGVASLSHGEPTRPPRTPPENPFKSPEGSQISYPALHQLDTQSRASHKVADQGNSASLLVPHSDSHPLPPPPPQPVRLNDRPPVGRQWTSGTRLSNRRSAIDWIVPVSEEGELHDQEKVSPRSFLLSQSPPVT